jgi:hypothetical protein
MRDAQAAWPNASLHSISADSPLLQDQNSSSAPENCIHKNWWALEVHSTWLFHSALKEGGGCLGLKFYSTYLQLLLPPILYTGW